MMLLRLLLTLSLLLASPAMAATYYVSSSDGNDGDDGLSEVNAKATFASAHTAATSGVANSILLKRGDTFTLSGSNTVSKSGGSVSTRLTISAYGSGADPIINGTALTGTNGCFNISGSYVTLEEMYCYGDGGGGRGFNVSDSHGEDILIQDCTFTMFNIGGVMQTTDSIGSDDIKDVHLRRNIITRNFGSGSNSAKGLYVAYIRGLIIEDCLIDGNGWTTADPATWADNGMNHNMYLTNGCRSAGANSTAPDLLFAVRRNIISRADTYGLKYQPNGGTAGQTEVANNCFANNGWHFQCGGSPNEGYAGVPVSVADNTVSGFIANANGHPYGVGVLVAGIDSGEIVRNLIVNCGDIDTASSAFSLASRNLDSDDDVGVIDTVIGGSEADRNVIFGWYGVFRHLAPSVGDLDPLPTNLYSGCEFSYNEVQASKSDDTQRIANVYDLNDGNNPSFHHNTYWHENLTDGSRFRTESTNVTFAAWQAATGDSTSTETEVTYTDNTRTAEGYVTTILAYADWEEFITHIETVGVSAAGTDHGADAINDWLREGFDMGGETPDPPSTSKSILFLR